MPEMKNDALMTPAQVTVVVETEDNKKFKIGTADLALMAAQVRPKAGFSVFNSIILPIGITVLTALLTTAVGEAFQYISWRNTTALQEAQDQIVRATGAYYRAAKAMDERRYATLIFFDAVGDMISRKQDVDSHLYRLDLEQNQLRYRNYYTQLNLWNETNDQILGEIDFELDRPVGIRARKRASDMAKIDCSKSLPEQLKLQGLNPASLKLQFAAITYCFQVGIQPFAAVKDKAALDPTFTLDKTVLSDAQATLADVAAMANEFRCYALTRIGVLKSRQGRAIYIPKWLEYLRGYTRQSRETIDIKKHFEDSTTECSHY